MAFVYREFVKKFIKTIIRVISFVGKALSEEDVVERVCREVRGIFLVYFESSLLGEVDIFESSVLFRGLVKRCSDIFFDLFFEKGKGKLYDKYVVF